MNEIFPLLLGTHNNMHIHEGAGLIKREFNIWFGRIFELAIIVSIIFAYILIKEASPEFSKCMYMIGSK